MKSLKTIILNNLLRLTAIMMVLILFIALFFQIISLQMQARTNAAGTFVQIQQIIRESNADLEATEAEYRETCLANAQVISYVIRQNPAILNNIEEFRQLAHKLEVDEIHIFDETGRIFTGTHPEYFDFTFDSGEQMNFFKPLLTDKSLRLCQDITPNTAEGKLVQYSAMWSSDEQYIVQVGMYPDAVLEMTEKNELSYIFSLLRANPGVSLYALDSKNSTIIGSSTVSDTGKHISEIGVSPARMDKYAEGAHATVNGVDSYCIFREVDGIRLGYVISNDQLYSSIFWYTLMLTFWLLVIAAMMVFVMHRFTTKYIVGSIAATNSQLRTVTAGNLAERVDVQSSQEFSELSSHINSMIRALLAETDKINLVLNRSNLRIGVYEYNLKMQNVRFTEHIPQIFGLDQAEMTHLASDYHRLQDFIESLRHNPVREADNTFRIVGKSELYIKLEEITNDNDVLGIVMDVTEETVHRMHAETERDMDLMTGLYNRRGMERHFDAIFAEPDQLGHGALIMLDSDNLKEVNDTYGHAVGDTILRELAQQLAHFDAPQHIAARTGGDEFVLLVYGYPNEDAVADALRRLEEIRETKTVRLPNGTHLPLPFSYGYEPLSGQKNHAKMLAAADDKMYHSKRLRKSMAQQSKPPVNWWFEQPL